MRGNRRDFIYRDWVEYDVRVNVIGTGPILQLFFSTLKITDVEGN